MFIRATSILRAVALLGTAIAVPAMLAQVAVAKAPVPRIPPGVSPYFYSSSVNRGFAPRPDFPGAKQADTTPAHTAKASHSAKHHKTNLQQ